MGPAVQAVVSLLDQLFSREPLVIGGGGSADSQKSGDDGDLEATATVEQEMAEDAWRSNRCLAVVENERRPEAALAAGRKVGGGQCLLVPARCRRSPLQPPSECLPKKGPEAFYSVTAKS